MQEHVPKHFVVGALTSDTRCALRSLARGHGTEAGTLRIAGTRRQREQDQPHQNHRGEPDCDDDEDDLRTADGRVGFHQRSLKSVGRHNNVEVLRVCLRLKRRLTSQQYFRGWGDALRPD